MPTLIVISCLVVAVITLTGQRLTAGLLQSTHEQGFVLMQKILTSVLKTAEDRASSRAELVTSMPAVRSAFLARDRPRLLAECATMYELQADRYGLDQAQFHTPPGVSFLRLHDPSKFGDDQTGFRPMLVDVHQTHVLRKGIALTKAGPGVFSIVPINDDQGKFAGSFEIGLDFAPILKKLKDAYQIEGAVYFEEKQLRDIATNLPPEILQPKNRVGKYIRFDSTHPALMEALVTDREVDVTEAQSFERAYGGTTWGVQLVPIYNYTNKQLGVFALATDFGDEKRMANRVVVWELLAGLFAMVLLAGIIVVVVRGTLLSPIASLGARMAELADGKEAAPADELDGYCEEVRGLAESYEKLRSKEKP